MTERTVKKTADSTDYVKSWEQRIIANAPKDETVNDVLNIIRNEKFLNRGRWAALVVRLGMANEREKP